jgi:hypothetical protein
MNFLCYGYFVVDVDTSEPDEKSLITYISSLYDVFPNPPALHPLYDPVNALFPSILQFSLIILPIRVVFTNFSIPYEKQLKKKKIAGRTRSKFC